MYNERIKYKEPCSSVLATYDHQELFFTQDNLILI
jgi:hypothetical protein